MNYCPTCNETGKSQGDHRFVLEQPGERMLLVVGLNPSTADETHPDPTVRKVECCQQIVCTINVY